MEEQLLNKNNSKGIAGSTLKLIAIISMLIDHTGATIVERMLVTNPANFDAMGELKLTPIVILYFAMRTIGRLAFPIFIYLMLEGFKYTRNRWRYLGRLAIFAIISEIPFDMAFNLKSSQVLEGKIIEFTYQNVFLTLAIGLLTIMLVEKIRELNKKNDSKFLYFILELFIVLVGMVLAVVLKTDYSCMGVLAIYVGYCISKKDLQEPKKSTSMIIAICITLVLSSPIEAVALVDTFAIAKYNGKRGINLKWIFYLFYPVHLLILSVICIVMGL